MKITKNEILDLEKSLNNVSALKGVKFAYAVARNLNIIKGEVEAIRKSFQPSEEIIEFERERVELNEKYAEKDKDGKPLVENNKYKGLEGNKEWKKKSEELNKKYEKVIKEYQKQQEEYIKSLEEEIDIELYRISLKDVPDDISTSQMNGIYKIIENEKDVK
jgi:Skp family chaperone for outer membrane proteins